MIGIAITAVRHLGDGVRWTAVRLARLESWLVEKAEKPDPERFIATINYLVHEHGWTPDGALRMVVALHGRGAAVDRASASLAGLYDERPAHCVVCGLVCGTSRCEWCARAEAPS